MAFFKFTTLSIAIDACDVAIIAPRTVGLDTDSTVLMARGQTVLPALTPAEAAAEVDATVDGDPLMAGPYTTLELGDGCYFGGRQVQRIAPTADGLGSIVTFGNVPAVLTVPDVDVDTMTDELNATGECGGGGGGTALAGAVEWDPTPVPTNASAVVVSQSTCMEAGFIDDARKVVTCSIALQGTCTAAGLVTLTIPLPVGFPCDEPTAAPAQGDPLGSGALGAAISAVANGDDLVMTFTGDTAASFGVWCVLQYESGAE